MYKISDLKQKNTASTEPVPLFIMLMKSKWDKIHSEPNVFRYKINKLQEKLIDAKYLVQLNPDRSINRRKPEYIDNISQPFDDQKFNFTKVSPNEIIFSLEFEGDEHSLLVNVSPISQYHTLLCPSVNKKLPQVVTKDSLSLVLEIMFLADDCDLKIGFNSLCALASVNHLHYHLFIEKHTLPVELVEWKQIKGPLHCTQDYPAPAFCFEVQKEMHHVAEIHKLIQYFLDHFIAHNILMSMRSSGNVAVYVWPRKSTAGIKQLMDFNVAVCELSGWFPVYSEEAFKRLQLEDLEREMQKWKLDNFDTLSKEVEMLYGIT